MSVRPRTTRRAIGLVALSLSAVGAFGACGGDETQAGAGATAPPTVTEPTPVTTSPPAAASAPTTAPDGATTLPAAPGAGAAVAVPSARSAPTTTAVARSVATTAVATTFPIPTTVPLPVPIDPPADDEAPEPVVPLGRLALPAIGIDRPLYEGIRLTTFDLGPGHWPGSAAPGQRGNMVIGGHRTSGAADFHDLHLLEPGDEMIVTTNDGTTHTYLVDSTQVTTPFTTQLVYQSPATTATLFACHPIGSTRERIVVRLTLAA